MEGSDKVLPLLDSITQLSLKMEMNPHSISVTARDWEVTLSPKNWKISGWANSWEGASTVNPILEQGHEMGAYVCVDTNP